MKKVETAFICDSSYIIQTTVALTSLKLNSSKGVRYINNILFTDEKFGDISKLQELSEKDFIINIIKCDLSDLEGLANNDRKYLAASKAALLKFSLGDILKSDKVLYLDGDIIIRSDLHELFAIDLNNKYAAVVPDFPQVLYENPIFDMGNGENYFNSGVMLLNLKRIRLENIKEKLINAKKQLNDDKLMDQNIFNLVFKDEVKIISPEYNLTYLNLSRSKSKYNFHRINEVCKSNFIDLDDLEQKSKIIHYSSKDKPWTYFDVPLADEWIYYYSKSPFSENKIKRFDKYDAEANFKKINFSKAEISVYPVVFCCNDKYIKNLSVSIQSLIKSSVRPDRQIEVFVLHSGLELDNIKKIESMVCPGLSIKFINISSNLTGENKNSKVCGHFTIDMYFRWFIPEVLSHYEKVLYLDCDLICCEDICKLFETNLNKNLFGACLNLQYSEKETYRKRKFGLDSSSYFNSGVLLFNIYEFIKGNYKKKLFDFVYKDSNLECPDQDAINFVCKGKIAKIDSKWNVQWHLKFTEQKGKPTFSIEEYEANLKNPGILHYTSNIKPWNDDRKQGADLFWDLAKNTPFYSELLDVINSPSKNKQKKSESKSTMINKNLLEFSKCIKDMLNSSGVNKKKISEILPNYLSCNYKVRSIIYTLRQGDEHAVARLLSEIIEDETSKKVDRILIEKDEEYKRKVNYYENRIQKIYNSPSMKITRPIRFVSKYFKGR